MDDSESSGSSGEEIYSSIFNFILIPLIMVFALASAIPLWISKTDKWHRDFQYLIHGVLVLKVLMLTLYFALAITEFVVEIEFYSS